MIRLADISAHSKILQPSCGEGVFLEILQNKGYDKLIAYEIDPDSGTTFSFVRYENFVSENIDEKFGLIDICVGRNRENAEWY